MKLAIDREVAEGRRGSTLHFDVRALEKEEDGFEGGAVHRPYICLFRQL